MTDSLSMQDFIFGTLASDEMRVTHLKTTRSKIMHGNLRSPYDPVPDQAVRITVNVGPDQLVGAVFLHYTVNGSIPTLDSETTHTLSMSLDATEWDTLVWGYTHRYVAALPGQPEGTTVRYRISATTPDGQRLWSDDSQHFSYLVDKYKVPAWVQDSVIYQIFVDRFAPPPGQAFATHDDLSGFYGGTLSGIQDKLDYLSDLGVNCLWLTPIFPSPSHHRYDATDFQDVDPRAGTRTDVKALVEAAHRRNMRVILDFIPNHTSNEHPYFMAAQGESDSPYRPFYRFRQWPEEYESFFGVKTLPQINHGYPEARKYVIDSAVYWLREHGVDGFRLDYAYGPSHDFWTDYYHAVKIANEDSFHFGEIVETPALLRSYEGVMDGALDFVFLQAIRKLFAFGTINVAQFEQFLAAHEAYFADTNFVLPTFLDNHDMNRFLWVVQGDTSRLKLAAVCQFTLSAPPVIYYGTEVGLSQVRDTRQGNFGIPEESRLPMLWGEGQNIALHTFYKKLIALRLNSQALRTGTRSLVIAEAATGRYGYIRQATGEEVVVLLNVAAVPQTFNFPAGDWQDMLGGSWIAGPIALEPYGYLIAMADR